MTNDTRQPVAPKEGHYAMLRNGMIARPIIDDHAWLRQGLKQNVDPYLELVWFDDGRCHPSSGLLEFTDEYDIIATISPESMKWAANPQCDYGIKSVQGLIAAADAACDYADSHCRAFPIATAPIKGMFLAWNSFVGDWEFMTSLQLAETEERHFTHWRPLPLPPSNPPLPAVFVELGAALEKIKGAT